MCWPAAFFTSPGAFLRPRAVHAQYCFASKLSNCRAASLQPQHLRVCSLYTSSTRYRCDLQVGAWHNSHCAAKCCPCLQVACL